MFGPSVSMLIGKRRPQLYAIESAQGCSSASARVRDGMTRRYEVHATTTEHGLVLQAVVVKFHRHTGR